MAKCIPHITDTQIEKLASRKGVKKIAVENFLGTLGSMSEWEARANMNMDAGMYKWNAATRRALDSGIKTAYKKCKSTRPIWW